MNRRHVIGILAGVAIGCWSSARALASSIYVDQTASYKYVNATSATTVAVPGTWYTVGFNDSGWFSGNGVFSNTTPSSTIFDIGNANAPFAPGPTAPIPSTFTQWDVNFDPYLRTYFNLASPEDLTIWIAVDNGINSLYLNGVLSTGSINAEGNAFRWESVFDVPAAYTFAGTNILALQLEDHGGLTGFDMMVTSRVGSNPPFSTQPPPETPGTVPEPSTLLLVGPALAGLGLYRRNRRG